MRTSYAYVTGADGREFQFKKLSSESKTAEATNYDLGMMSLIALVQVARGMDPIEVLKAFKLRIADENGQVFFDFRNEEGVAPQVAPSNVGLNEYYEDEGYPEDNNVPDDEYIGDDEYYDDGYEDEDDDYYEGAGGVGY